MSEEHQKKSFSVPAHIAIIMDGNGRWAKRRGLPRNAGHKQGAKAFENICDYCQKIGVKYVTVYAFSTENWKRPQSEVDAIMELLRSYLKEASKQAKRNVRLLFLGDRAPLASDLQQLMESAERESEKNTGITVCVALNYGGRAEIVHSARELAQMAARGELDPDSIDAVSYTHLSYRPQGKPMAWIFTIVRNRCLQKLRERGRAADIPPEDWEPYLKSCDSVTPEDRLLIGACMERLTQEERQIVVLHAVSGFRHREIAQILQLPLPTVLSKYHRALKKLKKYVTEGEER